MGLSGQPHQPLQGAFPSGFWAPQAPSMPSAFPAGPNSAATASWLQVLLTILGGARTVAAPGTPGSVGIPRTRRSIGVPSCALPWDRDQDLSQEIRHGRGPHGGMGTKGSRDIWHPGPTIGSYPSLHPFVNIFIQQNVLSSCPVVWRLGLLRGGATELTLKRGTP